MRAAIFLTLFTISAVMPAHAVEAGLSVQLPTNIPAQDLGSALRALAKERDFQIVYASKEVAGRQSPGAQGTFTNLEALQKVLAGTGMTYQLLDERTVTVLSPGASFSEVVQPERSERRATAPALPEVAISADRDELAAIQFDIACHERYRQTACARFRGDIGSSEEHQ